RLETAFFGGPDRARDPSALVFTDTFDDTNGVAGTMRRLAGEGARERLPGRAVTARESTEQGPRLTPVAGGRERPLPTYERLSLRFPLLTDVLAYVEEARPDVIHLATPGPVGVCGLVAARLLGLPTVGSYHTELGPYTLHLTRDALVAEAIDLWVDWFYRQSKLLLAPPLAVGGALPTPGPPHLARAG